VETLLGTLGEANLPANSLDVVTLWDVVEHLANPRSTFEEAWRILRPGGWLVVQTMNVESWPARLLGPRWPWLMEMHLHYFSPRTLSALARQVGFEPIKTARLGRCLRLSYLASRLSSTHPRLARGARWALALLHLGELPVFVAAPDLFTLFARRVTEGA
jgi:SAM-dependent methyltransferase